MIALDEVRRAILDLSEGWRDADAVASDMLKPLRARELGPALARENYDEARGKIVDALAYLAALTRDDSGGEHGDPSGNGCAGPTH